MTAKELKRLAGKAAKMFLRRLEAQRLRQVATRDQLIGQLANRF
jgi:hypothetical protein